MGIGGGGALFQFFTFHPFPVRGGDDRGRKLCHVNECVMKLSNLAMCFYCHPFQVAASGAGGGGAVCVIHNEAQHPTEVPVPRSRHLQKRRERYFVSHDLSLVHIYLDN